MEWLVNLFTGSGVAHSVFIVAMVIAIGLGADGAVRGGASPAPPEGGVTESIGRCHFERSEKSRRVSWKKGLLGKTKVKGAKAHSSEELKFLSSQPTLSYRVGPARDPLTSAPSGVDLKVRFAQDDRDDG